MGLTRPFREPGEPNAETLAAEAIKKMEEEIKNERGFSIQLPENVKQNDIVPLFADAINNPDIGPKGIFFYSLATGILKYHQSDRDSQTVSYGYCNQANPALRLIVKLDKKKSQQPTISYLSTKMDLERREVE